MHTLLPFCICLSTLASIATGASVQQVLGGLSSASNTPCELLATRFPGQVAFPANENYLSSQALYWTAQQSEIHPACRFFPDDAEDIKVALADVIITHNVSFAVASGRHSANPGASNIQDGITIDLSNIADITLVDNNEAVILGSGARWGDVYSTLERHHLTVHGARSADVGVGGFILGGGISWLSGQYGWACDAVLEFEVVTPNAEILRVNKAVDEDLFWALKGTLGAFGIVTKLKLPTIRGSSNGNSVYAGSLTYHWRFIPRILHALQTLIERASTNPATTQGFLSYTWTGPAERATYLAYLMNTAGSTWNSVLADFKVIRHTASTLRSTTPAASASELATISPSGLRRTRFALTSRSTFDAMMELHECLQHDRTSSSSSIASLDPDSALTVLYQPLPTPRLAPHDSLPPHSNMLDFDLEHAASASGPLLLVSVELSWHRAEHDAYFEAEATRLHTLLRAKMQDLGVLSPWIYPNYAHRDQDPFKGVNIRAKAMLERVRQKYDPDRLWRRLVPGIWHV